MRLPYDFETVAEARTYLSSVVTDIATPESQREMEQLYQASRIKERDIEVDYQEDGNAEAIQS